MSVIDHIHTDEIIIDADEHFTIDTVTRAISNASNKKITLMQYDNKSERYSFDIDRIIDGHDLTNCNRVQIHFINIGSNKQKHPGLYLVDDVHVNSTNEDKITFTWLISQDATQFSGVLHFLVSFECVDGDTVLYRWSSSIFSSITITAGMDNDNTIMELYADELLAWKNDMTVELSRWQTELEMENIPNLVEQCYVEREFATSEEVAEIFSMEYPIDMPVILIDNVPTNDSENLVTSGGIKTYTDNVVSSVASDVKTYTDNTASSIMIDTKTYTDNAVSIVISDSKTYADNAVSDRAKIDASNLSDENISNWQTILKVADISLSGTTLTITTKG